jgi:hypothetical protein
MTVPAFVGRPGEIASLDLLEAEEGAAAPVVICEASSCAIIDKDHMIGAHLGGDQEVDRQTTGSSRLDPQPRLRAG